MPSKRTFDPPLPDEEVQRVYAFTTWLFEKLEMPQWRVVIQLQPTGPGNFASVRASDTAHVGELGLAANWMTIDLGERVHTLVHECVHLTHNDLTHLWNTEIWKHAGSYSATILEPQWSRAIEMWTDHMTQVIRRLLAHEIAEKTRDFWGTP